MADTQLGARRPFGADGDTAAVAVDPVDLAVAATAKSIDMDAWGRGEPDDVTLDIFDKNGIKFG